MRYAIIISLLMLCGCETVATRSENGTLTLRGIGKAVWSDNTSIEGKPIVEFPALPPIKYEQ